MSTTATEQPPSLSNLDALDENALVEVLRAAKASGTLRCFANANWRLCTLARSRVPYQLLLQDLEQGSLLLGSHVLSRAPFSGCTRLHMLQGLGGSSLAPVVVAMASQWPALRHLEVATDPAMYGKLPPVLPALPSLQQQLQSLELAVATFYTDYAECVAQLVQLTSLQLMLYDAGEVWGMDRFTADLLALSRLTRLARMTLDEPPPVQRAAAASGPFCLPSSLTYLRFAGGKVFSRQWYVSPMHSWLTHLPGCPQLQHLEVVYSTEQHSSARPPRLIRMCAQHNQQLRVLKLDKYRQFSWSDPDINWGRRVQGLSDADGDADGRWHPDAALGSLKQLQCLHAMKELHISSPAEWQHLAQATALTELDGVNIHAAPLQEEGTTLSLVSVGSCIISLRGSDVARLLVACSALESAAFQLIEQLSPAAAPLASQQLITHPRLAKLELKDCLCWGETWDNGGTYSSRSAAAAAELSAMTGVLGGVSELALSDWPCGTDSGSPTGLSLPDLSHCRGLVLLRLSSCSYGDRAATPEQDDVVSMLSPLLQLRSLSLQNLRRVNARIVLQLRSMLPHLRHVSLRHCDALPLAESAEVQQQLGPGVELIVQAACYT